jgi:hypothetical protein
MRRRAFFLKQLETRYAWRGKIIDEVTSRYITPRINKGEKIVANAVHEYSQKLINSQYAMRMDVHYNDTNELDSGRVEVQGFFESVYESGFSKENLEQIRKDVFISLTNLLDSSLFRSIQSGNVRLLAQRRLSFSFADVTVSSVPDLIIFPLDGSQPRIIDWKVEMPVIYKEHRLQLMMYAYALSKAKPHKDYPDIWRARTIKPSQIALTEFQLLRNMEQEYTVTEDDLIEVEDYIYRTSRSIMPKISTVVKDPVADSFPRTIFPSMCNRCKYRIICWNKVKENRPEIVAN